MEALGRKVEKIFEDYEWEKQISVLRRLYLAKNREEIAKSLNFRDLNEMIEEADFKDPYIASAVDLLSSIDFNPINRSFEEEIGKSLYEVVKENVERGFYMFFLHMKELAGTFVSSEGDYRFLARVYERHGIESASLAAKGLKVLLEEVHRFKGKRVEPEIYPEPAIEKYKNLLLKYGKKVYATEELANLLMLKNLEEQFKLKSWKWFFKKFEKYTGKNFYKWIEDAIESEKGNREIIFMNILVEIAKYARGKKKILDIILRSMQLHEKFTPERTFITEHLRNLLPAISEKKIRWFERECEDPVQLIRDLIYADAADKFDSPYLEAAMEITFRTIKTGRKEVYKIVRKEIDKRKREPNNLLGDLLVFTHVASFVRSGEEEIYRKMLETYEKEGLGKCTDVVERYLKNRGINPWEFRIQSSDR